MKKYSSGSAATNGSKTPSPRIYQISDPYSSSIRSEANNPGMASKIISTPTPMPSEYEPASAPPLNMRPTNRRNNPPKGVRLKSRHRLRKNFVARRIKWRSPHQQFRWQPATHLVLQQVGGTRLPKKNCQSVRELQWSGPEQ